jgi:UDP-GlcNAc:undecaprenyl-phosphate GlcNAc-1-phosphate transferase
LGLVDEPNARKVHTRPTPKGGGLAIFAAVILAAGVLAKHLDPRIVALLAVGGVIVILGLIDDLHPLSWQLRLGIQALAAASIIYVRHADAGWLFQCAALLWIVGLINAFNMLDNMDALSAGVAWIAAVVLGVVSVLRTAGDWQSASSFLMLAGAIAGFLWFNRPPARIFMGDAGSTFLGLFLGVQSIGPEIIDPSSPRTWAVPLCVLAVPCYDMASVIFLRLWQGHSPFHADKQHLSHRLMALGLQSPAAVRVVYVMGLASGLCGLLLYQITDWEALLLCGQLGCWWLAVAAVEYFGQKEFWVRKNPESSQGK